MTPPALRPQAVAALIPRGLRLFSSARVLRNGRFTVIVPASASKQAVLDKIRSSRDSLSGNDCSKSSGHPGGNSVENAAVILASPSVAAWLEDDSFLSSLLRQLPFGKTAPQGKTDGVSVLSAVVDGLASPVSKATHGSPRSALSGLSIIHGDQHSLLPGLWKDEETGNAIARSSVFNSNPDTESVITVEFPAMNQSGENPSSPLRVALPLANTIFQNGRRSTLLASRWLPTGSEEEADAYQLACPAEERTHQFIQPRHMSGSSSSQISAPLLAVTEPRKIVAGLGNIVRQVEADGKPSPASRELESAIPALLAARRKGLPDLENTQMGVWGLIIPPEALPVYEGLKDVLGPMDDHSAGAEQQVAAKVAANFTTLLSAGCRLHRILSGGGGWGQKQGLLSLDPQAVHPSCPQTTGTGQGSKGSDELDEDAAMDSFIRSLRGETATQSGDVAMQGAYVQFLVAPLPEATKDNIDARVESAADVGERDPSLVLGVPADYADSQSQQPSDITLIPSHFGAVSINGIFVDDTPSGALTNSTRTKLDAPDSYVWDQSS